MVEHLVSLDVGSLALVCCSSCTRNGASGGSDCGWLAFTSSYGDLVGRYPQCCHYPVSHSLKVLENLLTHQLHRIRALLVGLGIWILRLEQRSGQCGAKIVVIRVLDIPAQSDVSRCTKAQRCSVLWR